MMPAEKFRHRVPCDPACPGWAMINEYVEPEIQRCDACWQQTPVPLQLSDTEAAMLLDAARALRGARARLADLRERARARRRMATMVGQRLMSPCCAARVQSRTISVQPDTPGDSPAVDYDISCSRCGRMLNVPPGIVVPSGGAL